MPELGQAVISRFKHFMTVEELKNLYHTTILRFPNLWLNHRSWHHERCR